MITRDRREGKSRTSMSAYGRWACEQGFKQSSGWLNITGDYRSSSSGTWWTVAAW